MKRIIIPLLIAVALLALAGTLQQCTKGKQVNSEEMSLGFPGPLWAGHAPGC